MLIPAAALTFLPEGDSSKADAEIYVGVVDETGRTSDIGKEEAAFRQPANGAVQEAALAYPITLQMRKGNSRIVVNVRDKATGKMGRARRRPHRVESGTPPQGAALQRTRKSAERRTYWSGGATPSRTRT